MIDNTNITISLPCEAIQIRNARKLLSDFIKDLNFSNEDKANLEIALNEGISNAIEHGSSGDKTQNFDLSFTITDNQLILIIKDYGGKEFNPEYYERITLKRDWGHGGRGIYLMKQIMDEIAYIFVPKTSTTLYMSKKIRKN